jgi:hypothetical protein
MPTNRFINFVSIFVGNRPESCTGSRAENICEDIARPSQAICSTSVDAGCE